MVLSVIKERTIHTLTSIHNHLQVSDTKLPPSSVDEPTLLYFSQGRGTLVINHSTYQVEPLHLYVVPKGGSYEGTFHSRIVEWYTITYEALTLTKRDGHWICSPSLNPLSFLTIGYIPLRRSTTLFIAIRKLYSLSQNTDHETNELDISLHKLLLLIKENSLITERNSAAWSGIQESITYMHNNYTQKIDRDTLARIAQLTPSSYCRSFKKSKGMSPMDYLSDIRINQAKLLLSEGIPSKHVAVSLGYASEYYFSRLFKQKTGLPPTLYLKREHLRVAVASRFDYHLSLISVGIEPVVTIDCYKHPGIDEADYERRLASQLEELKIAGPDLIIGDYSHAPFYDTFKRIAPTVMIDYDLNWQIPYMRIAELVGREEDANRVISQLNERIAEAAELLKVIAAEKRVAVMQLMSDHVILQGTINHPLNDLLYSELKLLPGKHIPSKKMRLELFTPDIPPLETEQLWIRLYSDHADVQETLRKVQALPFWQSIQTDHIGQIRFIDNWFIMSWTPQGRENIINDILAYFALSTEL
ncbi:AraC family transcriptional regulator [Paenibacillus sp. GSMTC-2017]|uniref:helix-turn-helix domain-containing protein n=1 Tax=Paenibacillus sp. GSMTC-2017 TaxID=2794350 RepID=UPI0018D71BB0|nr:AraC family transcriptional regulator [Paenibacillus sp. GSMTC-2017]MBH5320095.1 AraC family transcriptional regulator [Paenibacillus sp. GSMTC-2017]